MTCQVCVQFVYTDVFAELAEAARAEGAKKVSGEEEDQSGRLLQKLLDSVDNESGERGKDKKAQKAVHLVENLPLLPAKLVDLIQEGSFVDFFWFPVLEDGPSDGEYRSYTPESEGGPSGSGVAIKRGHGNKFQIYHGGAHAFCSFKWRG